MSRTRDPGSYIVTYNSRGVRVMRNSWGTKTWEIVSDSRQSYSSEIPGKHGEYLDKPVTNHHSVRFRPICRHPPAVCSSPPGTGAGSPEADCRPATVERAVSKMAATRTAFSGCLEHGGRVRGAGRGFCLTTVSQGRRRHLDSG